MKIWDNLNYWQKGAMIGIIIFFIISASISWLYFSKGEHSDMDGVIFLIIGIPLILITTLPTGFKENIITEFLIGTAFPYVFLFFSFLSWAGLGALTGIFIEKFFKIKKPRLLSIFLLTFLISINYVIAYNPDPPTYVHQHITNESAEVWPLIPYEIKSHLFNPLNKSIEDADYQNGDDIIIASGEEDRPFINPRNHLWNPDSPENGDYNDGVYLFGSAYRKAIKLWKTKVIPLYLKGEINESYYWLGRVAHLLEDLSVPAHSHNDDHNKIFTDENADAFEDYASTIFTNYDGKNYESKLYYYENLPNMTEEKWAEVDANDGANIELFRLFWFTAQRAQYFASDDREGNSHYVNLSGVQKNFSPSLWSGENVTIISNSSQISSNLSYISDAEIPHAMKAVAGLYRLYWDAVHIDWPANRHDNRRTGTTLLKGDMKKASDVDNYSLYLTNANDQEYVIRTSIADLDNNGYMDAVSVSHEKYDAVNGILTDFERNKKWEPCPSVIPLCWRDEKKWQVNLQRSVLSPPTLGNIDSNSRKEVVAPRRNSSLLVFNVSSNGRNASQMWEFIVPSKFSPFLGNSYAGELSGSAIADIDLDGTNNVIVTDFSRSDHTWPAQVYVLNSTGGQMFNATFGNGGAYGSPSIANIDDDDYPEVIVPSFYGVYVFDYDSVNRNFSLRCNTSDGLIDGEVVVYDVDRDNEYELIYSTATEGCSTVNMTGFDKKRCYNRTYIIDAKTCLNEGPSPINYSIITRVAPTVANLDGDSNMEIVTIGTNQKSNVSNLGQLIAYDAGTGAQEWVFNDSNTLNVSFASPDIADITGDGQLDIVFAQNNGRKVYILYRNGTLDFTYEFDAFIDNALAIGDLDSDGKAEIALKRAGSPVAFSSLTGFNEPPELDGMNNVTAIVGEIISMNASGGVSAVDPDGNSVSYSFSSPFNTSGLWQTTVNDTGNYSVLVEASDGNLSNYKVVDVLVFHQNTTRVSNFSDGSSKKLLNFTQSGNLTVQIRIPKNSSIVYSRLKVGGYRP